MARSLATVRRRRRRVPLLPTATLAFWRLRQTWRLLLVSGLGIVAAVVLVCAVPLFSQVAMSAGLRAALEHDPQSSQLFVQGQANDFSPDTIAQMRRTIDGVIRQSLGGYIAQPPLFVVDVQPLPIMASGANGAPTGDMLGLTGTDTAQAAQHVTVTAGRLPDSNTAELEIAVRQVTADALNLHIGSTLTIGAPQGPPGSAGTTVATARVVGIFTVTAAGVGYFGGRDFTSFQNGNGNSYAALASADTLLNALASVQSSVNAEKSGFFPQFVGLNWIYPFDISRITSNNLGDLTDRTSKLRAQVSDAVSAIPGANAFIYGGLIDTLQSYTIRIFVVQIPIVLLLLEVLGLVLLFISVTVNILVERQAEAIAVLRSRGATRGVVFRAMTLQNIGVALVALVAGPLLAIALVRVVAGRALAGQDAGALSTITDDPVHVAWDLRWFALAAAMCALGSMILSTRKAANLNVLALRRESARVRGKPFWQRLNLDLIFAAIAVTGYTAYSLAVSRVQDPRVRVILSPLALIAPIFMLLAVALVFLRVFPLLLRLGAWLAVRRRTAASMLALAQMARAPRQASRMTLLLALSTAFAIFTLIFSASQHQRTLDVAAYQVGADFAGDLASSAAGQAPTDIAAAYRAIPGVTSASVGYVYNAAANSNFGGAPLQLLAVDGDTFAGTAIWTPQDSSRPLASLMADLAARRSTAAAGDAVPAIVDTALWNSFGLKLGAYFTIRLPGYTGSAMRFVVVDRVDYIPTVYDVFQNGFVYGGSGSGGSGGLIVDYQSFATVYTQDLPGATTGPNHVWLASQDDAASLASVRAALSGGALKLGNLQDRRALVDAQQKDALQIDLLGVLSIGAATALALALLGILIGSWLSARTRVTNFAVLRALGTEPKQLAGVLLWEQSIVYTLAIALGVAIGFVLATVVLPLLVFANYAIVGTQVSPFATNVPPVHTAVPWPELGLALLALAGICAISVALMAGVVSRASIGQALRLNED
jgi:ABC-type lipoprotein release transport system permease subunit